MASTLSPSAIHGIISQVLYAPIGKNASCGASYVLSSVNRQWKALYRLYMTIEPAPPLDYLKSFQLSLVLKGEVDDEDVHAIFAHGRPLEFWGCPRLLVSKVVEAFTALEKEPTYLDVTITALHFVGVMRASEAWPQVYATHLPCYACTTVEIVEGRSIPQDTSRFMPRMIGPDEKVDFAVEKFHVSSKCFRKQLTLELHYQLVRGTAENEREQCCWFRKIVIRLVDKICLPEGILSGTAERSSATQLLHPDLAVEVFGFLERAHVGSSLLANRALCDLIYQLKQLLPLHHFRCFFGSVQWHIGTYWLAVRHFQRDLSYTDVRRIQVPSTAGPGSDCAMIRHYLSNSYVADLRAPEPESFSFIIKMLAGLAVRNVSVGHIRLYTEAERLSDYRSMDAVFGGMRMRDLYLSCPEHRFVELVKTTDFFRMSTIQGLRELKLDLTGQSYSRGRARSKSPLWVSGIYLLHNCLYYRVDYENRRTRYHLRSIERKIIQICEEFEQGKITDTVMHFEFRPSSSIRVDYAFSRDSLLVSGMKVEGKTPWDIINYFEWDVYRFRNASTGRYLTACVGRNEHINPTEPVLHLVKGEVYPDASFVGY